MSNIMPARKSRLSSNMLKQHFLKKRYNIKKYSFNKKGLYMQSMENITKNEINILIGTEIFHQNGSSAFNSNFEPL
jgi:hypothetical protein